MFFQNPLDKASISLSLLCAIHCVALPITFLIPGIASLSIDNESFHIWMVFCVLPLSLVALIIGCRQHHNSKVLTMGLIGLTLLIAAALFGEQYLSHTGEKVLTLTAVTLIAIAHIFNARLCREQKKCDCSTLG